MPTAIPSELEKAYLALWDATSAVVNHWNEFGPEHGFHEVVDRADRVRTEIGGSPIPEIERFKAIETAARVTISEWERNASVNWPLTEQLANLRDAVRGVRD